jgi:hypothetical protein
MQELERLQLHKQRLQQLQQEQGLAVERLGGAVEAVKGDLLAELAREQLAQVGIVPGLIMPVSKGQRWLSVPGCLTPACCAYLSRSCLLLPLPSPCYVCRTGC